MVKSAPPRQSVVRLFLLVSACFLLLFVQRIFLIFKNIGGKLNCWTP